MKAALKCPYCQRDIQLTWKRYLRAVLRHTCPHCARKSMLDWPLPYIALNMVIALFVVASARFFSIALLGDEWRTMTGHRVRAGYYVLVLLLVWIPLDRLLCARFRKLRKI